MFYHTHPYPPFIPASATKLIVGTLPPPRFTSRKLKPDDVDFCYGSKDGLLWPILDKIFELNLLFDNSEKAVSQRKKFLTNRGIGICDIVECSTREKIDASDLGMQDVELREMIKILKKFPKIDTLIFTGGNSKNGPEYFFRKLLKDKYPHIRLKLIDQSTPKIHEFLLDNRIISTVSLTAPSGAANISIGSSELYKALKKKNPDFNTVDFRVLQYKDHF
ncbi:uracil-DNA glycosylase family protein [Gramella sp. AN32]|uniref:Uracil-DNA glycosylase family protein n=1 Tax=Christiangramia antarctica TaxID=2058158 RepID=A0ABW5X8A8_9FLAO|nr:DNA glycosylase [Gramella sp. AN32]